MIKNLWLEFSELKDIYRLRLVLYFLFFFGTDLLTRSFEISINFYRIQTQTMHCLFLNFLVFDLCNCISNYYIIRIYINIRIIRFPLLLHCKCCMAQSCRFLGKPARPWRARRKWVYGLRDSVTSIIRIGNFFGIYPKNAAWGHFCGNRTTPTVSSKTIKSIISLDICISAFLFFSLTFHLILLLIMPYSFSYAI